ncbi:hypothetical protein AB0I51_05105 [Streptomyces sp. NPDC050549]|uniref:hypothetical protein n=1 Tax=Streptomyces sp. NPDC050549 TaxID=3155406 RepID=UPI00342E414B
MRSSQRLTVLLASAGNPWPPDDWPTPDDPFVSDVLSLSPPHHGPRETTADVVLLRCVDQAVSFPGLLDHFGSRGIPVIVISPRRDTGTVVEVFRSGAGRAIWSRPTTATSY